MDNSESEDFGEKRVIFVDEISESENFNESGIKLTQHDPESAQKIKDLQKKVINLQKLIFELAKWTEFDLNKLPQYGIPYNKNKGGRPRKKTWKGCTQTDNTQTKSSNKTQTKPTTKNIKLKNKSSKVSEDESESHATTGRAFVAKKSTSGIPKNLKKPEKKYFPDLPPLPRLELVQPDNPQLDISIKEEIESDNEPLIESFAIGPSPTKSMDFYNNNDHADCFDSNNDDFDFQPNFGSDSSSSDSDSSNYNSDSQSRSKLKVVDIKSISTPTKNNKSKSTRKKFEGLTPNPLVSIPRISKLKLRKEYNIILPPKDSTEKVETEGPIVRRTFKKTLSKGPFQCPSCPEVFKFRKDLAPHMREMHKKPRKLYTCEFCKKQTNHKFKHFTHVKIHTGEKPFLCTICGFATRTNAMLTMHNTVHSDARPFACEHCPDKFKTKLTLKTHLKKIHEIGNDMIRQCQLCPLVFRDIHKLKRHITESHEDKRTLVCEICGQAFKRKSHLENHVARHANPNRRKRGPQKPMLRPRKMRPKPNLINGVKEDNVNDECDETSNPGGRDPLEMTDNADTRMDFEGEEEQVEIDPVHHEMIVGELVETECETINSSEVKEFRIDLLQ